MRLKKMIIIYFKQETIILSYSSQKRFIFLHNESVGTYFCLNFKGFRMRSVVGGHPVRAGQAQSIFLRHRERSSLLPENHAMQVAEHRAGRVCPKSFWSRLVSNH
jgi:hypothetical protein